MLCFYDSAWAQRVAESLFLCEKLRHEDYRVPKWPVQHQQQANFADEGTELADNLCL